MKTKILSLAVVTASAILISCEKNEIVENNDVVRFTSGITATPITRVSINESGNSVWEKNDPVGIFMLKHGTTNISEGAKNIQYKASNAGPTTTFTPASGAIHYPMEETEKLDFIAYHPYKAVVSEFVYNVDVSDQTSQTAIDLMWAKADNNGQGYSKASGREGLVVNFAFTHKLVKLVMNVSKDASVSGNITSVKINGMNTTANFDLKGTDGLTEMNALKPIAPYKAGDNKYEAILLPVSGSLNKNHTVTFTTNDGETYVWNMSNEISSLEEGKIYTYTVNVTKYAVTAEGSINKWISVTPGTGTAE